MTNHTEHKYSAGALLQAIVEARDFPDCHYCDWILSRARELDAARTDWEEDVSKFKLRKDQACDCCGTEDIPTMPITHSYGLYKNSGERFYCEFCCGTEISSAMNIAPTPGNPGNPELYRIIAQCFNILRKDLERRP